MFGYDQQPGWSLSVDISQYQAAAWWPGRVMDTGLPVVGQAIDTQPVAEPGMRCRGAQALAFGADWYGRIHLLPALLELGNVIKTSTFPIEVWNSHDDVRTLQSITATGTTGGLALSSETETAAPIAFGGLQSRIYTLTVASSGDPIIDADYRYQFEAETLQLQVTGRRIVIWSFRPNWESGITERLQWATDILTAYDGSEQRVRLREHARRWIEYGFLVQGHDARLLESLTFGWGARLYCLPVWWEADFLAHPLPAGSTSVTVTDAACKDYRAGGLALFWQDTGTNEAVEILAITGNTLTLKLPLSQTFPAGSRVLPAVLARLEGETRYAHVTDRIVTGQARFAVDGNIDRPAAEMGPTWHDYAVLDERPDRSEDVSETWARTLAVLDYLTGMVTVDDTSGSPIIRRTYSWLLQGRTAIHRWKQWAAARAGAFQALWLPSFADDLELVQTVGSGESTIRVRNTLSARYVGAHPLRAAVRIELSNGTVQHRLVTGIRELDGTSEAIGIDSSLGFVLQPADVVRIQWMGLARLDADAVEIYYESDDIARLTATFRMVPS